VRFQFGDLTLDAGARQLFKGRQEIHLSPKAFELLKMLIGERPRALSKNELYQHLWPDTFVSEANLASLIAEIREALGDPARKSKFIRTAHRFGYAFCGEAIEEPSTPAQPQKSLGSAGTARTETAAFCWLIKDGHRLPLDPGENVLGRDPDPDGIRIDSPTVSRRHARISISAGSASLEDLDSKNGTFLKGEPVSSSVSLSDGDEIRIGSVVLVFRISSESTATWSEPR
jgi:DNA-binding winged helix-turn-helix (wHTH) protein